VAIHVLNAIWISGFLSKSVVFLICVPVYAKENPLFCGSLIVLCGVFGRFMSILLHVLAGGYFSSVLYRFGFLTLLIIVENGVGFCSIEEVFYTQNFMFTCMTRILMY
jgi:hypothetical protein